VGGHGVSYLFSQNLSIPLIAYKNVGQWVSWFSTDRVMRWAVVWWTPCCSAGHSCGGHPLITHIWLRWTLCCSAVHSCGGHPLIARGAGALCCSADHSGGRHSAVPLLVAVLLITHVAGIVLFHCSCWVSLHGGCVLHRWSLECLSPCHFHVMCCLC